MQPTPTQTPTEPQTPEHTHYKSVLRRLVDQAADLAQRIHAQATTADATPEATHEATIAFERAARIVRRTILLARQLDRPLPPGATPKQAPTPEQARTAARQRLIRNVEDTIHRESDSPDEAEQLHAELRERLDQPELEDDLETRPLDDIIAEIVRDLGLAKPREADLWTRRTPEDVQDLRARAAAAPKPAPAPPPGRTNGATVFHYPQRGT